MVNSVVAAVSVCQRRSCVMRRQTVMTVLMKSPVRLSPVARAPSDVATLNACLGCGCATETQTVPTARTNRPIHVVQVRQRLPKITAPLWNSNVTMGNAYTKAGNVMGEKIVWIGRTKKTAVRIKICFLANKTRVQIEIMCCMKVHTHVWFDFSKCCGVEAHFLKA